MNISQIIQEVYQQTSQLTDQGSPASYIPELANVAPDKFGVHFSDINNNTFGIGDYQDKFSIQSISKVLSLCLAYKLRGEKIWSRLGVEPSGNKFNSLVQLESDNGIPRNPFINAGAIVIADILYSSLDNPREEFLQFVRNLSGDENIHFSPSIAASEKSVGYRNIALCNFLKSYGNIDNEPEEVLDFYFDFCSIECSCEQLNKTFLFLANHGKTLHNNEQVLTKSQSKRINAIMQTCGHYDESGEFAYRVGLAAKSGVGGGIVAIHPNQYAITVWSPALNAKGNSFKGIKFLEEFTTRSEQSIF